jgi:hypothetical protein
MKGAVDHAFGLLARAEKSHAKERGQHGRYAKDGHIDGHYLDEGWNSRQQHRKVLPRSEQETAGSSWNIRQTRAGEPI